MNSDPPSRLASARKARATHRKMGTGQAAIGNYIDDAVGSVACGRARPHRVVIVWYLLPRGNIRVVPPKGGTTAALTLRVVTQQCGKPHTLALSRRSAQGFKPDIDLKLAT